MSVVKSLEGRAFVEFALSIPAENGSRSSFLFNTNTTSHVRTEIKDNVSANSAYHHRFRAKSVAVVDQVLKAAMSDGYPTLLFRVGIGVARHTAYLPWQRHTVTNYTGIIEGIGSDSGHYFELTTQDRLWDVDRSNKTAAHSGTISDIVARLAANNGIEQTVIEPTQGVGVYYQVKQGDADFIRRRILSRAVNAKGHGNYKFFMRDNALHFHTPEYHAEYKELAFYGSGGKLLSITDNSQRLLATGISGCRAVTYDPLTGKSTEDTSKPDVATKYSDSLYKMDNIPSSQRVVNCHVGGNRETDIQGMVQSTYEAARMATFALTFQLPKTIHIRAGDILNLLVNPETNRVSAWSGLYYVVSVTMIVDGGDLSARVLVNRGETRKIRTDVAVQSDEKGSRGLSGEHEAPGQPVNLKALQASTRTEGAAYSGTDASFAPVKDPNR